MEIYQSVSSTFTLLSFILIFLLTSSPVLSRHHIGVSSNASVDSSNESEPLRTYIVRVQPPTEIADAGSTELESWYRSFLSESISEVGELRLVHSYSEVFVGFAAKLTKTELNLIQKKEGFVHAFPAKKLRLLTTRTPAFLGLQPGTGLWNTTALGRGIIIGLLDSGIAPSHPSFSDDGVPPPPAKWKGSCAFEAGCNNKLIGARSFAQDDKSPFDNVGHGTHTASTAAGNFVQGASAFGQASGTAAGVAPHAHLAMYKVCSASGCWDSDLLAGLDAAVKDRVDVISISLGGETDRFFRDVIAIGAFGAFEKGVFVSCAAGNQGPRWKSLSNEAPWYITVGATSVDRSFKASVQLYNNDRLYEGESLNQFNNFSSAPFALAYSPEFSSCTNFTGFDIRGKLVLCDPQDLLPSYDIFDAVKNGGGIGVVLVNAKAAGFSIATDAFPLPTVQLSAVEGGTIIDYASRKRSNLLASISFNGTVLGTTLAPSVAFFSSRGPNFQNEMLLKPDVSAPGLNILAAWPTQADGGNDGKKTFNIISGTSMATPHVSGVAALIKSLHPDWSPAAIKSAIITTSDVKDKQGLPIFNEIHTTANFYEMGAGHVNPSKAVDPGLVYDIGAEDYIRFLCTIYGDHGANIIVRSRNVSCSKEKQIAAEELNLPSIVVPIGLSPKPTVTRTVTNVGKAQSTYKVQLEVPLSVKVTVTPSTLSFSKVNEKKTFQVSVDIVGDLGGWDYGHLRWVSDEHVVRSPIIILDYY